MFNPKTKIQDFYAVGVATCKAKLKNLGEPSLVQANEIFMPSYSKRKAE